MYFSNMLLGPVYVSKEILNILFLGPHVDSTKFSGDIVSSLSLVSARVLRLTPDNSEETIRDVDCSKHNADTGLYSNLPHVVEVLIEPRAFYVISGIFRYRYAHEILGKCSKPLLMDQCSLDRRISVMFRDIKSS
jgi:hypothetical protein